MKTKTVQRHEFHLQGDEEDNGLRFELEGGMVHMEVCSRSFVLSAEDIERIAAALAEHRARDFDSRSVCPDHGYYQMRDSASGYKCSVCDPKPKAEPEVLAMPMEPTS